MTHEMAGMVETDTSTAASDKPKRRKRRAPLSRDLRALRTYVQSLETQTPRERRAAILWLVDYYGVVR